MSSIGTHSPSSAISLRPIPSYVYCPNSAAISATNITTV